MSVLVSTSLLQLLYTVITTSKILTDTWRIISAKVSTFELHWQNFSGAHILQGE